MAQQILTKKEQLDAPATAPRERANVAPEQGVMPALQTNGVAAQAAVLSRLPTAQRQTAFRQIERVQGNQYAQRLVARTPGVTPHVQRTQADGPMVQRQPGGDPIQTHEESLLGDISELPVAYQTIVTAFLGRLNEATETGQATEAIETYAAQLWEQAKMTSQANVASDPEQEGEQSGADDTALYWARLHMTHAIRNWNLEAGIPEEERQELLRQVERYSRGAMDIEFGDVQQEKKILLSGFDPFSSGTDDRHSNPSGIVAMALDGQQVSAGGVTARIESVVFPVRRADYESDRFYSSGVVRDFYASYLDEVDLILGLGLGAGYELEAHANNNRVSGSDNNGETREGRIDENEDSPDTIPTTWPEADQQDIYDEGGPGTYLCNELFYRTLMMVNSSNVQVPVGFLHVPNVSESGIRDEVMSVLASALTSLQKTENEDQ